MSNIYLIALGSNRRHHRYGAPAGVVQAAMEELAALGTVRARSAIIDTPPMGAAQRRFSNAAALVESELDPDAMLAALQWMEREFGRRRWRRWGDRVIDLDIVLWAGGTWCGKKLRIPHAEFRRREFVLAPARQIAGDWRDPESGLSLNQLFARLTKRAPIPR
ncbi:2-amino-4-hydroxy-6-hydroxymethyldihydropteridine diphosphokinase [Erythrobacteraceae bacterium E2-1 Yellow Sea]|nr:2-amino-4-hydroxy-6-hydroxymethyldihydropteridine diphosphokinase [Erythrobacteraceae bacterium E2-1 Yellow Sea]